jgi:hypothetical protein
MGSVPGPRNYHRLLIRLMSALELNRYALSIEERLTRRRPRQNERPRETFTPAGERIGLSYLGFFLRFRAYHGWVMAYDAHTLRQRAEGRLQYSPDGEDSGIWASDTGPVGVRPGISTITCPGIVEHASGRRQKYLPSCPRCRQQVRSTWPQVSAQK